MAIRHAAAALLLILAASLAGAQETGLRLVDPRPYGVELPPGIITSGNNQAVTTADDAGRPAIGRVHVMVGEGAVILLPDGELVVRKAGDFQPTDRKFQPLTAKALTERLKAEFPGFKVKTTNHYLYVYDTSDVFQLGTSRILETMLPGVKAYAEQCKIDVHDPPVPLVAVMFRTEADFQKHRRMPEGVVAYYDVLTNRVYMYEQSQLAEVMPELAVQQAIATVAHEGGHQILANIGVQHRLSVWPMWLSEGLAEFFAPTSMGARLKWKGPGQVNDLRMFELEQYLQENSASEPKGEMVEYTVLAAQLSSTGYASAWALTHYLAKNRRSEFNGFIREVSQLQPLSGAIDVTPPGVVRSNREQFRKTFGDDFKQLEAKLVAHLRKQPYTDPFINLPHFVATLECADGRRPQKSANTFHSPELAHKWRVEMLSKLPASAKNNARSQIRVFPNRVQAEAYARQWLQTN